MEQMINPEENPQTAAAAKPAQADGAAPAPDSADSEPLYSGPADKGDTAESEPAFLAYIRPSFWD